MAKKDRTTATVIGVAAMQYAIRMLVAFGLGLLAALFLFVCNLQLPRVPFLVFIACGALLGCSQGLLMYKGVSARTGLTGEASFVFGFLLHAVDEYIVFSTSVRLFPDWHEEIYFLLLSAFVCGVMTMGAMWARSR